MDTPRIPQPRSQTRTPVALDVTVNGVLNFVDGQMCGDADFDAASQTVAAITPVPGGVGTVTTSVLVSHVVEAAKRQCGM